MTGAIVGELVAGLQVGMPVGVLPPWGVIAVAVPWPMGTQPPLATQTSKALFKQTSICKRNEMPFFQPESRFEPF